MNNLIDGLSREEIKNIDNKINNYYIDEIVEKIKKEQEKNNNAINCNLNFLFNYGNSTEVFNNKQQISNLYKSIFNTPEKYYINAELIIEMITYISLLKQYKKYIKNTDFFNYIQNTDFISIDNYKLEKTIFDITCDSLSGKDIIPIKNKNKNKEDIFDYYINKYYTSDDKKYFDKFNEFMKFLEKLINETFENEIKERIYNKKFIIEYLYKKQKLHLDKNLKNIKYKEIPKLIEGYQYKLFNLCPSDKLYMFVIPYHKKINDKFVYIREPILCITEEEIIDKLTNYDNIFYDYDDQNSFIPYVTINNITFLYSELANTLKSESKIFTILDNKIIKNQISYNNMVSYLDINEITDDIEIEKKVWNVYICQEEKCKEVYKEKRLGIF